jgi:serine/threonine protein kinase
VVNEIVALGSIRHKNVIHLFATVIMTLKNRFAVEVMEFGNGGTFQDFIWDDYTESSDRRNLKFFMYMDQLIEGLMAVNNHGFMHLDIKPANIVISQDY